MLYMGYRLSYSPKSRSQENILTSVFVGPEGGNLLGLSVVGEQKTIAQQRDPTQDE